MFSVLRAARLSDIGLRVPEPITSLSAEERAYVRLLQNPYALLNFAELKTDPECPVNPDQSDSPPNNQIHEPRYDPQSG